MKTNLECDLKLYNAYKLNSVCSKAYFPQSENDFIEIYRNTDSKKIIIGNGNNIILSKKYYEEEFIILNGCFDNFCFDGNIAVAEAGTTLQNLSEAAQKIGLSGLEIFYDIPSSVGGAVVMNAGTKDGEIKDVLIKARYLDLADMKIKEIDCKDIEYSYRNSLFQKHPDKIVLKAWFDLKPGDPAAILDKMEKYKTDRWEKQPRDLPNCGSVFKRPPGRFVGPMIDELGLKGLSIGGAMVSKKHSGFIVNTGNATGQDILNLIAEIQKKVRVRFGVELEVEQRII